MKNSIEFSVYKQEFDCMQMSQIGNYKDTKNLFWGSISRDSQIFQLAK